MRRGVRWVGLGWECGMWGVGCEACGEEFVWRQWEDSLTRAALVASCLYPIAIKVPARIRVFVRDDDSIRAVIVVIGPRER